MATRRRLGAYVIICAGAIYMFVAFRHPWKSVVLKDSARNKTEERFSKQSNVEQNITIIPEKRNPLLEDPEAITIVTAFFNIGSFKKGNAANVRGADTYLNWMRAYARLMNPVVAYFDDEKIADFFQNLRYGSQGRTTIILINRDELWSFKQRDRIKKIFETPGYPHHLPNTVVPEYSCAMHAKFELLQKAADANYYETKFIGWMDIGIFRFDRETSKFGMVPPPEFDPGRVSYSVVGKFDASKDFTSVIRENRVWVSGSMNLGTIDVMRNFSRDYLTFAEYSMENGFISTDQQVLYGMYTDWIPGKDKPVRIQEYTSGQGEVYFRLAYLCRDAWRERQH